MNSVQSFIEHLLSFRHGDQGNSAPGTKFSKVLPIGKMLALSAPSSVAEMWLGGAPLQIRDKLGSFGFQLHFLNS